MSAQAMSAAEWRAAFSRDFLDTLEAGGDLPELVEVCKAWGLDYEPERTARRLLERITAAAAATRTVH